MEILMFDREERAHRYGFQTFSDLLDKSHPLPLMAGERHHSYLAQHPDGHWLVWDEGPFDETAHLLKQQMI